MAYATQKRPPSLEAGAREYAIDLYTRLRCEHGWRKDIFMLLRREYARFAHMAIAAEFDVLAMWEYAWLVDATHQYLCTKRSVPFSQHFYRKVCTELEAINARIKHLEFDEQEKESMRRAFDRMAQLIKTWETLE